MVEAIESCSTAPDWHRPRLQQQQARAKHQSQCAAPLDTYSFWRYQLIRQLVFFAGMFRLWPKRRYLPITPYGMLIPCTQSRRVSL